MARTRRVVDGEIEITETPNVIISRVTKRELQGQRDEIQTKIDHLLAQVQEQMDLKQNLVDDIAATDAV